MKIENATAIIRSSLKKIGYKIEERKSLSTNSVYFKIYAADDCSLLFRVSDHPTKSNVITLRLDKKTSQQSVESFAKNRCNDLGNRHMKQILRKR